MTGRYSIDVARPRAQVFEFLVDEKNLPEMVPNLVEHGTVQEKPEKVGTTFWHVYEENGRRMKMTGVVTEYRAPERFAVALDGPIFSLQVSYELEELGHESTRLTQLSDARFKHVFKLMGLLFGKKMEREGKKAQAETFAHMKSAIEKGTAG